MVLLVYMRTQLCNLTCRHLSWKEWNLLLMRMSSSTSLPVIGCNCTTRWTNSRSRTYGRYLSWSWQPGGDSTLSHVLNASMISYVGSVRTKRYSRYINSLGRGSGSMQRLCANRRASNRTKGMPIRATQRTLGIQDQDREPALLSRPHVSWFRPRHLLYRIQEAQDWYTQPRPDADYHQTTGARP